MRRERIFSFWQMWRSELSSPALMLQFMLLKNQTKQIWTVIYIRSAKIPNLHNLPTTTNNNSHKKKKKQQQQIIIIKKSRKLNSPFPFRFYLISKKKKKNPVTVYSKISVTETLTEWSKRVRDHREGFRIPNLREEVTVGSLKTSEKLGTLMEEEEGKRWTENKATSAIMHTAYISNLRSKFNDIHLHLRFCIAFFSLSLRF